MSDYKRFVSYIYGYEQGEKGESTGFVKVNARGDECRIWVHMRGFYSHGQQPYRVYVFKQKRDRLEGHLLGELESRNGALEWNGTTERDSLMGGFGLDESRGLYIEGENRVFAAEWDDYPVDVEQFESPERYARQASANVDMAEASANVDEMPEEEEKGPEQTIKEDKVSGDVRQESEAPQPEDPRKQSWEYLESRFPVVRYVDGGGAVISSIRLGSKDLARVPRDKWELGNNSFLLHGFYQHHHLLLLRRQTEKEICYMLGVPGIFNEKEQMLASMFGFKEFKMMKGPEEKAQKEGSSGYWCRILG